MKQKRILDHVLYAYLEKHIAVYAKRKGNQNFGNVSAYINYLVAKDAGDRDSVMRMQQIAAKRYGVTKVKPKEA